MTEYRGRCLRDSSSEHNLVGQSTLQALNSPNQCFSLFDLFPDCHGLTSYLVGLVEATARPIVHADPLRSVVTGRFPVVRLYWLNSNRG